MNLHATTTGRPLVALGALAVMAAPAASLAQQFQLGWSIGSSQGRGGSSAASQVVRSTASSPGVLLLNATADQPGTYRLLDPSEPFLVLESSETSVTTTNSNSVGFSTFSGSGVSVFHTPVTP